MRLIREVIQATKVWLVGQDQDVPGSFRIVEGEGFHGQGGWTVRIGCVVHWVEEDKVYLTLAAAEARLRALSA